MLVMMGKHYICNSGTTIHIIHLPTQYNTDCDTSSGCSHSEVLLYSQGSSLNGQGFAFYFLSSQTVKVLNTSCYDKTTTQIANNIGLFYLRI